MSVPKRLGRPPLDASGTPTADVHLTLRAADYDRIHRLAKESRKSVQEVIRLGLKRLLTDERSI